MNDGWLEPLRVGNEEILHHIWTALAVALNRTRRLNAFPGMEFHANLQVALWHADNCEAVLRERSQRFSPGLQLSWLHTTLNNRLNAGLKHLNCPACAAEPAAAMTNTARKGDLNNAKWARWKGCYLKHFTTAGESADKRNSNGQRGRGEHCLLAACSSELIRCITLERLNPSCQRDNDFIYLFFTPRESVILTDDRCREV